MEITKETSRELLHGHTTAGAARCKLTVGDFPVYRGILLRTPGTADSSPNTAPVWIGGPSVTADSSSSGGIPLPPGSMITIPVESTGLLYVISTAEGQDLAWMAI